MEAAELVGVWRLVSWTARAADGTVTHPFGEGVTGQIIYTAGGEMAVQIAGAGRPDHPTEDPFGGSGAQQAAAFASYLAYSGRFAVEEDAVVHLVEQSLFPNWVGGAQRRLATLEGGELVLRTAPMAVGGSTVVNELRWRRVRPKAR